MKIDWKARLHSYAMWSSGLSFVGIMLSHFRVIDLGEWDVIVNAGLSFAVVIGFINNPTQGHWYGDTHKIEE